MNFNPPSPCGEGRDQIAALDPQGRISIHPPRVGRDAAAEGYHTAGSAISIHPPRVGRDTANTTSYTTPTISIHPPRVGRDQRTVDVGNGGYYFNPPSPCGEGPSNSHFFNFHIAISIHPPRVGRDELNTRGYTDRDGFQSTLPVWGGTENETH